MIATANLNEKNIYCIPIGDSFDKERESLILVYAPFVESMFIATADFVARMEKEAASGAVCDEEMAELVGTLVPQCDYRDLVQKNVGKGRPFNTLSILPNNICNFSCSYCYSAQGRSGKKLSKETLNAALVDFVNAEHEKGSKIYLSIFGGGEPFMTPDLVKYIIERAKELSDAKGLILRPSLVTNGSIVNDDILRLLREYDITVTVSFEIIEEIQNAQRAHFKEVGDNIRRLLDEGVFVRIRSTITNLNVDRLREMVRIVTEKYPGVVDIMMEEVTDPKQFRTIDELRDFYSRFLENFNEAREYGVLHGKNVDSSSFRNYSMLIDRFCPGELCLTPEGTYSICSRVSSPLDSGYLKSIYGRVEGGRVVIASDRLEELVNLNVYTREKCRNCFVKWHCGGGCYAQNNAYGEEYLNVVCDYKREYTKRRLLKDLDDEYRQTQGVSLRKYIDGNNGDE